MLVICLVLFQGIIRASSHACRGNRVQRQGVSIAYLNCKEDTCRTVIQKREREEEERWCDRLSTNAQTLGNSAETYKYEATAGKNTFAFSPMHSSHKSVPTKPQQGIFDQSRVSKSHPAKKQSRAELNQCRSRSSSIHQDRNHLTSSPPPAKTSSSSSRPSAQRCPPRKPPRPSTRPHS
jgi:hypothetical protein